MADLLTDLLGDLFCCGDDGPRKVRRAADHQTFGNFAAQTNHVEAAVLVKSDADKRAARARERAAERMVAAHVASSADNAHAAAARNPGYLEAVADQPKPPLVPASSLAGSSQSSIMGSSLGQDSGAPGSRRSSVRWDDGDWEDEPVSEDVRPVGSRMSASL